MIVRIAMFEVAPKEWSEPGMEVFLKWMASQPGFVRGNHLKNPKTGGGMSVSYWETHDQLIAMKERRFPGGPMGITPTSVDFYDVVDQF